MLFWDAESRAMTTPLDRKAPDPVGLQRPDEHKAEQLLQLVYNELRSLARKKLRCERRSHTLQPTALVHEVFLRLLHGKEIDWQGRTHFMMAASQAMRRILIDHARGRRRIKRGANWKRVQLDNIADGKQSATDVDTERLRDVLERLHELDQRQSQVVDLHIFCGMTMDEIAETLGYSKRTIEGEWAHAKAWLRRELSR